MYIPVLRWAGASGDLRAGFSGRSRGRQPKSCKLAHRGIRLFAASRRGLELSGAAVPDSGAAREFRCQNQERCRRLPLDVSAGDLSMGVALSQGSKSQSRVRTANAGAARNRSESGARKQAETGSLQKQEDRCARIRYAARASTRAACITPDLTIARHKCRETGRCERHACGELQRAGPAAIYVGI